MELQLGQPAPDFTLPTGDGSLLSLSDFRGRWVVVYFYPKDDTPGCTQQACDFRDLGGNFQAKGAVVLGISKDSPASHTRFAAKHALPFPLLSDEDGAVCEAYGVWREKQNYGKTYMGIIRSTFIIDPEGKLNFLQYGVKVKGHVQSILEGIG